MALESATYVSDLSTSNPTATDFQSQGDDHLRLIKSVLQATFPNASKVFRLPSDVADKTADYTVVFPDDQNKIIQVTPSTADITVTLPSPTGVNANGWEVTIQRRVVGAGYNVVVAGTINTVTNYTLRHGFETVRFIYLASQSMWVAVPSFIFFPAATALPFIQTTAPVGWVKRTGAAYENAALRMTTGSVGTGGSTAFTSVFTSRSIAQANLPNVNFSAGNLSASSSAVVSGGTKGGSTNTTWGSDGGGLEGPVNSSNIQVAVTTTISGSVPSGGSGTAMDFAVKYVDSIIADKA